MDSTLFMPDQVMCNPFAGPPQFVVYVQNSSAWISKDGIYTLVAESVDEYLRTPGKLHLSELACFVDELFYNHFEVLNESIGPSTESADGPPE